jgi:two-component system NtrC family sensor kinase
METYLALLGCACVVNAACAGVVVARDDRRLESRLSGATHLAAAFWALCELFWNQAPDRETALLWMRISAPGWIFIGPLVLQVLSALGDTTRGSAGLVRAATCACLGLLGLAWTTPWLLADAVPTAWGWGYRVGPLYPVYYAITLVCVGAGYRVLPRLLRRDAFEAERRQGPMLMAGMLVPLALASVTDAILPLLDVQVPRLGTTSFAVLGLLSVTNVLRFGYSLTSPGRFSDEILATLGDGVALLGEEGRIRTANAGLERLTGRTRQELEASRIEDVVAHRFDRPAEEVREVETELLAASGERVPVAVTSRVVRDRKGYALGLVVSMRDLRELASLRTRLVTSGRLAAVGQLAAGIAHEINNPLAFVRANLGLLQDHWKRLLDGAPELRGSGELAQIALESEQLIEESLEGVDRAAEIVRGVKDFSHAGRAQREPADLHVLLDQVLALAGPHVRGRADVERCYGELPPVHCSPQQLKQVFLNLVVNAAQAVETGGRIVVATRADGGCVEVDVADSGRGIAPEIRDRIFDPFFTTKAVGEGTGLGLGIAYQIVRSHGGSIEVESEPGLLTRFTVRLPVAPPEEPAAAAG